MNVVLKIIIGLIGLSFLIFFHETGHFLFARLLGIKVEAFSIGMGPVLLHKNIKGTDYRLSLIPVGGYCSMKGSEDFQEALENGYREIKGDKDSFYGAAPFKRLIVAFAGPFFNLIFTFMAMYIIACVGYTYFAAGRQVKMADEVLEGSKSSAHDAGMQSGDIILKINNKEMNDFYDIASYISIRGKETLLITVSRNNEILEIPVTVDLDKESGSGRIGIYSDPQSVIEREYPSHNFFTAWGEAFKQSADMINTTVKSFSLIFKGIDLTSAFSGPAGISSMIGETTIESFKGGFRTGLVTVLNLLAFISISLFFTNLLPLPLLDGGTILFALIEMLSRRKMPPKVLRNIQYAGIAVIALLFVLAIAGDIQYFIK